MRVNYFPMKRWLRVYTRSFWSTKCQGDQPQPTLTLEDGNNGRSLYKNQLKLNYDASLILMLLQWLDIKKGI